MTTATTTFEIDMGNVLELLAAAVETRGRDYVYRNEFSSCSYMTDDDRPMCLIGVLIHQLGADLAIANQTSNALELFGFAYEDTLPYGDPLGAEAWARASVVDRDYDNYVTTAEATLDAALVMLAAQGVQDSDREFTWGAAYDTAAEVHRLLTERAA